MKDNVTIQLFRESDRPLYMQLFWQLKSLIREGVFLDNEKLPAIREMAAELGVNNITVINAYRQLEKEGLAYSKVGSGTYVCAVSGADSIPVVYGEGDALKMMGRGQIPVKPDAINFASATPTPDLFPVDIFKILMNRILDRDKGDAFGYQEVQGYQPLRQSICRYLEAYSVKASVDSIQVVSGAQQGIDVVSKALIEYGDCVFVESPTYRGALEAFKSRGATIQGIPIEEDGINLEELEQKIAIHSPKFIYLMPNFQNPTGYSYSSEKKRSIIEMANRYNTYVVEDDFLSELAFGNAGSVPLKALDGQERVIYIKSFSKIFMPGLRLGFMVVPGRLWARILSAKHTTDISTSGLIQRAFDLYLREDMWVKHIDYMKEIYRERYGAFVKAVKGNFPDRIDYKEPGGGLHLWFRLPEGYSSEELYSRCIKKDVLITPGSMFYADNSDDRHFRLSFASVHLDRIEKGVSILGDILEDYLAEDTVLPAASQGYSPFL